MNNNNKKMITKKKAHRDLIRIRNAYIQIVEPVHTQRNKLYSLLGIGCVAVGTLTFFIPLTTIPLIIAGLGLMGLTIKDLIKIKRITKYKLRNGIYLKQIKLKMLLLRSK